MSAATAKLSSFETAVNTVRKTRRAYIGAHVMAFEFAQKRAAMRLEQLKQFGEYLVVTGEGVEANASDAMTADKYAPYAESVLKYDPAADRAIIKKIVDHCGIALSSRDGKFVACSDAAEREVVAKSWLTKKLGLEADAETLDAKIGDVCEIMKADRMKNRVTFYYLLAKAEGKLTSL